MVRNIKHPPILMISILLTISVAVVVVDDPTELELLLEDVRKNILVGY